MRPRRHQPSVSPFIALLFPCLTLGLTLDCKDARDDGVSWDLGELGGPISVMTSEDLLPGTTMKNTTFSVDICKPLQKAKGIPKQEDCPNGTRGTVRSAVGGQKLSNC